MTTMAEGPTVPSQLQRARDLLRDRGQNSPDRQQNPVSDARLTALVHETVHLVAPDRTGQQGEQAGSAALRDGENAIATGLAPQVPQDQQSAPGSASQAGAAITNGTGKPKGSQRDDR